MAYRLSGYPSSVEVSVRAALVNPSGSGLLSAAKTATPGTAAGSAPSLWGSIDHGAELSANSLNTGTWQLDGATVADATPDSPYTDPQTVTEDTPSVWGRINASTDTTEQTFTLTAGVAYPFVAMVKAGTSNAARITFRRPSTGAEARLLTTGFASTTVAYSSPAAGVITGGTVENLADGYKRPSGFFTPDATGSYTFGAGPNADTGNVVVYGGAIAEPDGPAPDPDPEGAPIPLAGDQWTVFDGGTDGTLGIVRIYELPFDNGSALTGLGYRLNGSAVTIPFPSISAGDYQITVPEDALASVVIRGTNANGGSDSAAKTFTSTTAATPDIGAADALTYANDLWTGKGALDPDAGQIILLGATTLSSTPGAETYINGVRLFNVDGSQWHVRRWGDLQYVPNGAHDDLNGDEFDDVSVAWRKTGDVSSSTFTLRVYGSQDTGDDLARGVSESTSMTLTSPVPDDAVLEVAFTAGGSACTPSLGGVAGTSCPAGKRDVQYIRAPSGGSAALTFTTTPSTVYARVVLTPGDAASIRRMSASRSGSTLSLDWRTMPRAGFPSTAGWQEAGGTPSSPLVLTRASGATGFQIPTGYIEWKRYTGPGTNVFIHDINITGANSVVKMRGGFSNVLLYDAEGYGPANAAASDFDDRGNLFNPLENTAAWPDSGVSRCYDTYYDHNLLSGNNESIDGDAYIMNMLIRLYFLNGEWKNTGDAIADMKGASQFQCITAGQSQRALRAWHHPTLYGRTRLDGPYSQAVLNQSERGGIIALWMVDQPGSLRIRDEDDVTHSLGLSAFSYVADIRQTVVMRSKPAFAPEADYAATDFEFQQSIDGGASWSSLNVDRAGPNDAWGATRRSISGISTSITHVRGRALWGAKVGEWQTVAVTT